MNTTDKKLLLVGGLGQSVQAWNELIKSLSILQDIQVLDIHSLIYQSNADYIKLYKLFLERLRLEAANKKLYICGISLGAVLTLQALTEQSLTIEAAILIAAQYKMPRTLLSIQNMAFGLISAQKFAESRVSKKHLIALTNSMKKVDLSPLLSDIKARVDIVCGSKDYANKRAAKRLHTLIDGSQLTFVEGAGHEVNVECPAELAKEIEGFIFQGQ